MRVVQVNADRREEWNAFVAQETSFALLQSWEWGEFKEKMGWSAFRVAVEDSHGQILAGAQLLIKSLLFGMVSGAYVPRGPVGRWLDAETAMLLFSAMHQIARRYRAVFLRIEPALPNNPYLDELLRKNHFRPNLFTNQPRASIVVDLTPELDDMLESMHQKTRYNIRYAHKKGVTVRTGGREDLATFHQLMAALGRDAGFPPRKLGYLAREWETFAPSGQLKMFVACHEGKTLAINVSALFGENAAYLHGASSDEGKSLMPNYLLIWEAMRWAKSQGCRTFDLWGIPDEVGQAVFEGNELPVADRTDGLWGVYRFKKGFSTNVVYYGGAHDYIYEGFLNRLLAEIALGNKLEQFVVWLDIFKRSRRTNRSS